MVELYFLKQKQNSILTTRAADTSEIEKSRGLRLHAPIGYTGGDQQGAVSAAAMLILSTAPSIQTT